MKRTLGIFVGVALSAWLAATSASAQEITLIVDVGSVGSVGMGPGGMLSTGGGPIMFDNQLVGTFMHTSQTMTMQGMMGMQSWQHRTVTLQLPGIGTVFAMIAGGTPWTGAKGIIMGGTDAAHGISGTVMVGGQVGPNQYPFVLTLGP